MTFKKIHYIISGIIVLGNLSSECIVKRFLHTTTRAAFNFRYINPATHVKPQKNLWGKFKKPTSLAKRNNRTLLLLSSGLSAGLMSVISAEPIHDACQIGDLKAINNLILQNSANLEKRSTSTFLKSYTPLIIAAEYGKVDAIKLLLEKGVHINATTKFNQTALSIAAQQGHKLVVEELIKKDANPFIADIKGETAFHKAQLAGHEEIAELIWNYQIKRAQEIVANK